MHQVLQAEWCLGINYHWDFKKNTITMQNWEFEYPTRFAKLFCDDGFLSKNRFHFGRLEYKPYM